MSQTEPHRERDNENYSSKSHKTWDVRRWWEFFSRWKKLAPKLPIEGIYLYIEYTAWATQFISLTRTKHIHYVWLPMSTTIWNGNNIFNSWMQYIQWNVIHMVCFIAFKITPTAQSRMNSNLGILQPNR